MIFSSDYFYELDNVESSGERGGEEEKGRKRMSLAGGAAGGSREGVRGGCG